MHLITRQTWILQLIVMLVVPLSADTTQLQITSVLSEQSGLTPSGQHRVTVFVKVIVLVTVSVGALGFVKTIGTETNKVIVKKPSPTGVRLNSVQVIPAIPRAQGTTCPTVNGPVGN